MREDKISCSSEWLIARGVQGLGRDRYNNKKKYQTDRRPSGPIAPKSDAHRFLVCR